MNITLCHGRNPNGNKWPLTTMAINGHFVYPDLIAWGLGFGIIPWWFDVESALTSLKICESV